MFTRNNYRRFKKLCAATLIFPLLQASCVVGDSQQFADFVSGQLVQLWARGFQAGVGELMDRLLLRLLL